MKSRRRVNSTVRRLNYSMTLTLPPRCFRLVVVTLLVCWMSSCEHEDIRPQTKALIPQGYVGWVRVEYGVPGTAPLERYYRLPPPMLRQREVIPPSGLLQTSTRFGQGGLNTTFYYLGDSSTPVPDSSITCLVTFHSVRFADSTSADREFVTYFVAGDGARADACLALEKYKSGVDYPPFSMNSLVDLPTPGNINANVAR